MKIKLLLSAALLAVIVLWLVLERINTPATGYVLPWEPAPQVPIRR